MVIGHSINMWLTDSAFLQMDVTFCEYLVFHEFSGSLCITFAKYIEEERITGCCFFKLFIHSLFKN